VPVWAAILVSLASGGLGAWLTTWNDRHERFRDRMIEAADDFGVAASEAFVALRTARDEVQRAQAAGNATDAEDALNNAWTARDAAMTRSTRIDLLFGPGSAPGLEASGVLHELAKGRNHVRDPTGLAVDEALIDGPEHLRDFQRRAFDGIRKAAPPSATIRESIRQALHKDKK
jgi:hypothetical protein